MLNLLKTLLFALLLVGCSSEPPIYVLATDLCNEKYKNKIIITEGLILLPSSFYTMNGSVTMSLGVEKTHEKIPSLSIKTWGDKKNIMEPLNDGYTENDVIIYDDNGKIIPLGAKVRVTGKLAGGSKTWCEVYVDKIEQVNN